jgi:hypothetical protein
MNKVKSFVDSFVAIVKGDDATAQAEKAKRQADSALKTHISILEGDLVNKEDAVTAAGEAEANAVVNNGQAISSRDSYVEGLLAAKNRLTSAEADLKKHQDKIAFLKAKLAAL